MQQKPGQTADDEKFVDPDLFSGKKLFTTYDPRGQSQADVKGDVYPGPKEEGSLQRYNWIKMVGQGTFGVV